MKIDIIINKVHHSFEADPEMPLLWLLRDEAKLKGTKFGCGKALCGACSVHVDDDLIRSCSFPVNLANGKNITTIEGLSENDKPLHHVQQAWLDMQVPQCGYCQPGFMMAAAKLLEENSNPTEEDIKNEISNICRCGTQPRIIKAILHASKIKNNGSGK